MMGREVENRSGVVWRDGCQKSLKYDTGSIENVFITWIRRVTICKKADALKQFRKMEIVS